jgi:hypothetical protein
MILLLNPGQYITPTRQINRTMVSHWRFAKECDDIGGGMMPGAELKVVEVGKAAGNMWVKAELSGRYPSAFIKIAGEEFAWNFRFLR